MSQLLTLIWLKWRLLRNSLRSSKAVVNRVASILGMLIALFLALIVAAILGFAAYGLSQPDALGNAFRRTATSDGSASASAEFIFFSTDGSARWWEIWKWPIAVRYGRLFRGIG